MDRSGEWIPGRESNQVPIKGADLVAGLRSEGARSNPFRPEKGGLIAASLQHLGGKQSPQEDSALRDCSKSPPKSEKAITSGPSWKS